MLVGAFVYWSLWTSKTNQTSALLSFIVFLVFNLMHWKKCLSSPPPRSDFAEFRQIFPIWRKKMLRTTVLYFFIMEKKTWNFLMQGVCSILWISLGGGGGFLFYHILMLKYGNNFEKHYHMAYYHIFGYLKKLPYLRLPYLRKLSEISPYPITIFAIWE